METPQLNLALAKAKLEFPKILENKKVKIPTKSGREISFAYAELEEIALAVTPSLSEFGLTIVSQLSFCEDKFCLVTSLRHESGEAIASYFPLPYDPASDPKELGIKISYGRRYNTICLLEITTIEPSNQTQREEQVRKLARDLKQEAGLAQKSEPQKKDGSFIEAVSGYPKSANGFNAQCKDIMSLTGHTREDVLALVQRIEPKCSEPNQLGSDRFDFLISVMIGEFVGQNCPNKFVSPDHASDSWLAFLAKSRLDGKNIVEAARSWLASLGQQNNV